MPITRQSVRDDLIALGARTGDLLYFRAALRRLGIRAGDIPEVLLGGILDAIGPTGTLIVPGFTDTSFRWSKAITVSRPDTPPTTGAFASFLLTVPGAVRSTHPTHSFIGLGPRAREILDDHPASGASFEPIRALVEADGLMTVHGCVPESPGFSTVHLAQYDLGLSQRHYMRLLLAVRLGSDGPLFHPVESPGCSRNFGAFYKDYIEDRNFACGHLGKAWSIGVRAAAAYARERAILEQFPRYTVCDVPDCSSCRIMRGYNKRAIPAALFHRFKRLIGAKRGQP